MPWLFCDGLTVKHLLLTNWIRVVAQSSAATLVNTRSGCGGWGGGGVAEGGVCLQGLARWSFKTGCRRVWFVIYFKKEVFHNTNTHKTQEHTLTVLLQVYYRAFYNNSNYFILIFTKFSPVLFLFNIFFASECELKNLFFLDVPVQDNSAIGRVEMILAQEQLACRHWMNVEMFSLASSTKVCVRACVFVQF